MFIYHSFPTLTCVTLEVTHITYSPSITHGLAPQVLEVLDFYVCRNSTHYPPNTNTECCKVTWHSTFNVFLLASVDFCATLYIPQYLFIKYTCACTVDHMTVY